ncbi:peptidoglycan/xylan/chitin deacetylase (PgdA/CDA1 family) [Chryseobacterium bernardetii]|uniref:Peptidoglycan/xylan/chitin deacetylase (PgdA/CDA1 family) n=2 Tax=Chryseobacterium TaxID=59732 RepID=A0ACC6J1P5_9FLAO|nr:MULTISPECIES: polysaccharide deacetylase family protein [Chryseobacterium]MDR6372015.1 peptidoglycan/xylan/chitin deacetylase (PgdA/CDA1 family) [Chryseobacterium vietnamense]MDR6443797.1 peptidoglycan/xylan/chitin deacetylase (PgdA/CDA1 family) [Chryseobacterium bernardetii]
MKEMIINVLAAFESENIGKSFPLDYCLPLYHSVSDQELPHLKHVIRYKTTQQFEDDLDHMARNFQFVNWQEFKDYRSGSFKPSKKIALLTFDDGFREFYDIAAPILERKGIYACNFINPAFIDNKEMMFRCKASLLADAAEKQKTIDPEIYFILSLKNADRSGLQKKILSINYQEKDILDQLAEKFEVDFKAYSKQHQPYLSTDQLKELTRKGFGISSHSWDHPKYGDLSLKEQMETTDKTFNYLKENDFLYESFAFPFTDFEVKKEFFDELYKNKEIYCSFGCAGIKLDSVKRNFQRIPMEMGESGVKILKKEIAYFRLKSLINKNTIVRK